MHVARILSLLIVFMSSGIIAHAAGGGAVVTSDPNKHFDKKGKQPSKFTIELNNGLRKTLPFEDKRDFEEAKKGFIAAPPYKQIMAEAGNVAWDMGSYEFLLEDKTYETIHPSLMRQAVLNMAYGLYEVVPDKIYQVRGYDLANISFIKGKKGWIVIDPLTAKETAAAALKFINEKLGARPVIAVIYSHSHGDHFGGAHGVINAEDAKSGKVKVIAPIGFMDHAISENIYAGNAMTRRMYYQYGVLLPRSPYGHVDQSIGKNTAAGNMGLIPPNTIVKDDFEEHEIDGVKMIFQNTPGTEAPAEMNTYFPQFKAFWAAENVTGTVHNIYTLRGALVRDPLKWSKLINEALYRYGREADVMFASHSWPRFGNARVQEILRTQRDIYADLNNQVLRLANQGVTINQVHNVYRPPESLQKQWAAHSYHGSEEHNSRAVINRYLGYWDANPATLIPLSPEDSGPLYVEMMGGPEKIMKKARSLYAQGKYRHAMEILNKLVYGKPGYQPAKDLLADVFEQIGYQKESPSVRNSFLAGALELRNGIPTGATPKGSGPDMIRGMTTDLWLDFLGIQLDCKKGQCSDFVINFNTPDNGERFVVELSNSTLTNIKGVQAKNADMTLTIDRSELEKVMMGMVSLDDQIKSGKAKLTGNRKPYDQLKGSLVRFTPNFEIMPGTKQAAKPASAQQPVKHPFEAELPAPKALTD